MREIVDDLQRVVPIPVMALQHSSDGYAEAKEELLTYCHENDITFPFYDYPYAWAEISPRPRSPSPDFTEIAPNFHLPQEEPPDCTEELQIYLNDVLTLGDNDALSTRKSEPLELEMLVPRQTGPETLRKYGPESLKKCALLLPKEILAGEHRMEISTDMSEVMNALAKDMKLAVTEEEADYLRNNISHCNQDRPVDFILSKVLPRPSNLMYSLKPGKLFCHLR